VVDEMESGGASASVCAYLRAVLRLATGRVAEGLTAIEASLSTAPDFLDALLLKGMALRRLGRGEEARVAFDAAIDAHPQEAQAYEQGAVNLLLMGRVEDAKATGERAAKQGVRSALLERLGTVVAKALRGPVWGTVYEYRSRNYHVLSDIDKATCVEASKMLEEALTSYRVNFRWVARDEERLYKVYVFGGQQGFLGYSADLQGLVGAPTEAVAGLYSPLLKQLLIWNLPGRDAMLETIRHEGFHQYLDRLLPDPPIWLNEGLAVYHQNPERVRGTLKFGRPLPQMVQALRKEGLLPLETFLEIPPQGFYALGTRAYAEAWALVHLFLEGGGPNRALFNRLVDALQTTPTHEALAQFLPPEALKQLEKDLRAHLAGL
jgi:tetratricopeptide (TPR) repeat protein